MNRRWFSGPLLMAALAVLGGCGADDGPSTPAAPVLDYRFDGPISREVLVNYLSRAITMSDMCLGFPCPAQVWPENLRLVAELEPKFLGRTAYVWGWEDEYLDDLQGLAARVEEIHAIDPEIIVQACIFEFVSEFVERIELSASTQAAFGLEPVARPFSFEAMKPLLDDRTVEYHGWPFRAILPDITRLETRLWFYQLATFYIDAGIEAIHLGRLGTVAANDGQLQQTAQLLDLIRAYAAQHARRHWVLLDAHTHGLKRGEHLLLDFHSYPLRLREIGAATDENAVIQPGFLDAIYGRSLGGTTPSGWVATSLPYLVEFDNGFGGPIANLCDLPECVWGNDEITWFASRPAGQRDEILQHLYTEVPELDSAGRLQMPGQRPITIKYDPYCQYYFVHEPQYLPGGFGQEHVIRELWGP